MRNFIWMMITAAVIAGCQQTSFRKTPGGMPYHLYPGTGGKPIAKGNFIRISIIQKVNDSVYYNSEGKLPVYRRVNETPFPYDVSELYTQLKTGDSLVTVQMMDTFIKRNPEAIPPQFKKGDRITTYIKILDVFENDSAARVYDEKARNEFMQKEVEEVAKYIADKKISAQKTPSGAFVEIIKPGTGNLIDSGNYISVMYRGTSFSGKVFDTNMDSSFHHTEPLSFVVGAGQMVRGFDEGMKFLRNGAEGRLYIPSMLGYGGNPQTPDIKPFEHIMFDIKVIDVKDKAPVPKQLNPGEKVDTTQHKK